MATSLADIPIQFVKGVGPARAKTFAQRGVHTVEDLFYLFPYRYEDRTKFTPIASLKVGAWQTVSGEVLVGGARRSFTAKQIVEVVIGDDSGRIYATWFNQPYLASYFKPGVRVVVFGRLEVFKNRLQMVAPDFEVVDDDDTSLNMGRIVPVYPLTKGIGQKYIRKIMDTALQQYANELIDVIPLAVRKRQGLVPIAQSIRQLHFPANQDEQGRAMNRIAFEEFFLFQISVILRRWSIVAKKGTGHGVKDIFVERFSKTLPFKLTTAQIKVMKAVGEDMRKFNPMLRLLQGDVGSGKTIVAFFACLAAITDGHQAAIMAPTEILAQQHHDNFKYLFANKDFAATRIALMISSLTKKEKDMMYNNLKEGRIDLIIGTHSLIEEDVVFKDLTVVVIDEQHKFGVSQRSLLSAKAKNPDVLVMSATPIPRTLCLTLYGDLDVSVIDELPPGRGEIKTYHVAHDKAQAIYQKVREWVKKGTQAYIVYPIVEESEKLNLKAAKDMFVHLSKFEFQGLRLALVHGQMKKSETDVIMQAFKRGEIDILVATTILEVGIDVANANVMVIEHAERFGLSQLHQLRGRIGRGKRNAVCVLIGDATTEDGKARLEVIVKTTDGFKIAEHDLAIRGPGHYFGRHQHGLNELRVANPITQMVILEHARKEAINLIESDPKLKDKENVIIQTTIQKRYPQYLDLVLAG